MCVCVYVYIYIYIYVYINTSTYIYILIYLLIYLFIYLSTKNTQLHTRHMFMAINAIIKGRVMVETKDEQSSSDWIPLHCWTPEVSVFCCFCSDSPHDDRMMCSQACFHQQLIPVFLAGGSANHVYHPFISRIFGATAAMGLLSENLA